MFFRVVGRAASSGSAAERKTRDEIEWAEEATVTRPFANPSGREKHPSEIPTYDKSNGVAGWEPAKLCAKLTFPPICLAAPGGTLALPPMGMPPNHPAPLPTGPANPSASAYGQPAATQVVADPIGATGHRASASPIFPFGNLFDTARPAGCCCCCCCCPPNPPGMPRSACGTAPDVPRMHQHASSIQKHRFLGWSGREFDVWCKGLQGMGGSNECRTLCADQHEYKNAVQFGKCTWPSSLRVFPAFMA
jgi:hypothetical protein